MKGFDPVWCSQIKHYVQGGSVGIRVNNDVGHNFQTRKGVTQYHPLSPILFNIIADMLAILIARAKQEGLVGSLLPHLVDGGVSIRQYADDTIFFMEHDIAKVANMKLILCIFKQLSGKILTFIRVSFFASVKLKTWNINKNNLLDVSLGLYRYTYPSQDYL
jgi:hypothetical protein